ncbi:MAG: N-acetylmuramic acid 6-phosphate etherase [Rickettsiales bacterium]|nr:N-acetylmuramic acid 6-phosphate etherase [Rickettsiales bacterium]
MANIPDTEKTSKYDHIEKMSTLDIVSNINQEDQTVALSVQAVLPQVATLIDKIASRMEKGGRLFYIGSGTSGRLGVVDASECPPTFGVPHDMVIGIIAGGDGAIRKAVEFAEDDENQAWEDLLGFKPDANDSVIGIAASGNTPYVIGGVEAAKKHGLLTGCVACSVNSRLGRSVDYPIEVVVGPEFISGSTRMKSGTAQKMILNMVTTGIMIRLGRIKGNKMVDMQLTNKKLEQRGVRMLVQELQIDERKAEDLLQKFGSVRAAIEGYANLM